MVAVRSSVFWDVTQRMLVSYQCIGQPVGPIFKDQALKEERTAGLLKMELIGSETSATDYQSTLHKIPEEQRF